MDELSASRIVDDAVKMGADDAVCQVIQEQSQQVRFSNNEITAAKEYNSVKAKIFVAKGKKKAQFTLENVKDIDEDLKKSVKFLDKMQENKDYYGIAKGPFVYGDRSCDKSIAEADAVELAFRAIEACEAQRLAGVLYTKYQKVNLATPYTESEDERSFIEISVRAFENESSGHAVNCSSTLKGFNGEKASEEASDLAKK